MKPPDKRSMTGISSGSNAQPVRPTGGFAGPSKKRTLDKRNPPNNIPLILEMDAALWLLRNQGRLARCCVSIKGKYPVVQLSRMEFPQEFLPKSLHKYLAATTPIPTEVGTRPPFMGKFKFKGFLKLTAKGARAWKLKGLPGLTENGRIDIDAYLDNAKLGEPDARIKSKYGSVHENFFKD